MPRLSERIGSHLSTGQSETEQHVFPTQVAIFDRLSDSSPGADLTEIGMDSVPDFIGCLVLAERTDHMS